MPPRDHSFSATFIAVLLAHLLAVGALVAFLFNGRSCQRAGAPQAGQGAQGGGQTAKLYGVNLANSPANAEQSRSAAMAPSATGNDAESKITLPQAKQPEPATVAALPAAVPKPAPKPIEPPKPKPEPKIAEVPKVKEPPKPEPKLPPAKLDIAKGKEPQLPARKPVTRPEEKKPAEAKITQTPKKPEPKPLAKKEPAKQTPAKPVLPKKPVAKPKQEVAQAKPAVVPKPIPNIEPPPLDLSEEDDAPPARPVRPAEVVVDRPVVPAQKADDLDRPVRRADVVDGPGQGNGDAGEEGHEGFAGRGNGGFGRENGDGGFGGRDGAGNGTGDRAADMGGYKAQVERMIKARWAEPKGIEAPGLPVVKVSINRGGIITSSRLVTSSGDAALDDSALQAARAGVRLLPLPMHFRAPTYDLTIKFQLD